MKTNILLLGINGVREVVESKDKANRYLGKRLNRVSKYKNQSASDVSNIVKNLDGYKRVFCREIEDKRHFIVDNGVFCEAIQGVKTGRYSKKENNRFFVYNQKEKIIGIFKNGAEAKYALFNSSLNAKILL